MKKVILIAFYFNQVNEIASKRLRALAKYLPQFGWEPIVIVPDLGFIPKENDDLNCRIIYTEYEDMFSHFSNKFKKSKPTDSNDCPDSKEFKEFKEFKEGLSLISLNSLISLITFSRPFPLYDSLQVLHKLLGGVGAQDRTEQFALGVENQIEGDRSAPVALHQRAPRRAIDIVFRSHKVAVEVGAHLLALKDPLLHHAAGPAPIGIEVDKDQLVGLHGQLPYLVGRSLDPLHLRLGRAKGQKACYEQ